MLRSVSLFAVLTITPYAYGQAPAAQGENSLGALRQTAEKTSAAWNTLATGLEPKIARLLPCDPNARAAVEDVSRASAVRLAALSAYLHAEVDAARQQTEAAKQILAAQATLGGAWAAEHAEADQDHTSIDAQLTILKESMRRRGALIAAAQILADLSRMAKDRTAKADAQAAHKDQINILLGNLAAAYASRLAALENESSQLDLETERWNSYYAARVSRAATECAIISRKK